jgi:hypothetical protein
MVLLGLWAAVRSAGGPAAASLAERREQLLQELTQLELRRRSGGVGADRFASRRTRLVSELEQVYGDLDQSASPGGGGEGVAA